MNTTSKMGTEITVRISLSFQDSPNVHTLLAMTPVRERRKLIFLALERYIDATGHPAGNIENQIEEISRWLRSRNARVGEHSSESAKTSLSGIGNGRNHPELIIENDNKIDAAELAEKGHTHRKKNPGNLRSAERWLDT